MATARARDPGCTVPNLGSSPVRVPVAPRPKRSVPRFAPSRSVKAQTGPSGAFRRSPEPVRGPPASKPSGRFEGGIATTLAPGEVIEISGSAQVSWSCATAHPTDHSAPAQAGSTGGGGGGPSGGFGVLQIGVETRTTVCTVIPAPSLSGRLAHAAVHGGTRPLGHRLLALKMGRALLTCSAGDLLGRGYPQAAAELPIQRDGAKGDDSRNLALGSASAICTPSASAVTPTRVIRCRRTALGSRLAPVSRPSATEPAALPPKSSSSGSSQKGCRPGSAAGGEVGQVQTRVGRPTMQAAAEGTRPAH